MQSIIQHTIKKGAYACISLFMLCLVFGCQKTITKEEPLPINDRLQRQFQEDISTAIVHLDSIQENKEDLHKHFKNSRRYFKKIEPILSSLDIENYGFLNQPNILKVEEEDHTDIKIKTPSGYQVLEEEIFTEKPNYQLIDKHIQLVTNRLKLVSNNTSFKHLKNYHFLWMLRKSFVRIALTGITGFDSPVLESSLQDAQEVYLSLKHYLAFYHKQFKNPELLQQWNTEIDQTITTLNAEFNNFDRYHFIKNHTHKQLQLWNKTVKDWGVHFPFALAIKNDAPSLFSDKTFHIDYFSDHNLGVTSPEKIILGKKLFYDTQLSTNNKISCASCHHPDKAFTDGKKIATGITRNTPTLLYAALQKAFFYDKRAGSLEGQIVSVIQNKNEFHTNLETLEKGVLQDTAYTKAFSVTYPEKQVNDMLIRNAIASYIRSLSPFSSKFDKNMNGQENSLTQSEINGFNLFNGKAKCATCHFAPLFNGTVPPDYKESEIELIGVPAENDTIHATISKDLGRYYVFNTPERKHFFKTSTVRNISKTAPYMHNGVYSTLEEVVDFYNRGGGAGIGIHQKYQTLPPDALNLTPQEMNDIIAFMNTLTDKTEAYR